MPHIGHVDDRPAKHLVTLSDVVYGIDQRDISPTDNGYKVVPLEYMEATQYPDVILEGMPTYGEGEGGYPLPKEDQAIVPTDQDFAPQLAATGGQPESIVSSACGGSAKELGEAFVQWLRQGVLTDKIIINDAKAKVHSVAGTALLVTPGIFQRYAQEHPSIARMAKEQGTTDWRWIQRCFEKLGVHSKCSTGLNIWACEVRGPRKTRDIRGYLLKDPLLIFSEKPYDNPYLALKGSQLFKDENSCI